MTLARAGAATLALTMLTLLVGAAPSTALEPVHASPATQTARVNVKLRTAVADLRVRAQSHVASYDRGTEFGDDWAGQGGGCDTRAVVLKDESQTATTQNQYCTVETGKWFSFYNAKTYPDASSLQVDHVVPVENVWVSGGWHWTQDTRVAYYNDLGDPRTLVAVDAHDNEAKGDSSPDEWMPPTGTCRYIRYYVVAKTRWDLNVTKPEETALAKYAAGCPNVTLHITPAKVTLN